MSTKSEILALMPDRIEEFADPLMFTAGGWEHAKGLNPPPSHHRLYWRLCYAVANHYKPRSILEIGVRLGYSLGALMIGAGLGAHAEGWDTNSFIKNGLAIARLNLLAYAGRRPLLCKCDSQDVVATKRYDLVHVDASHTYAAAKHDIMLAINGGARVVLVDDYHQKNHPGVYAAVQAVAKDIGGLELIEFTDADFPGQGPTKGAALLVMS